LSNHYNLTRTDYYRHLDRASKGDEGVVEFILYAVRGFVDGLRDQLGTIRHEQFKDRWTQYIYERFAGNDSRAAARRRELVLALSHSSALAVKTADLRRLTPKLAELYADKTDRTLSRDVNELHGMGLIEPRVGGWVPARHLIEAFLPLSADPDQTSLPAVGE
jgi:hypothetical protein